MYSFGLPYYCQRPGGKPMKTGFNPEPNRSNALNKCDYISHFVGITVMSYCSRQSLALEKILGVHKLQYVSLLNT